MKLVIKFGGYQEPASIHNRAAARFGELLERAARRPHVAFELIGSILKLGRPSGDLVPMVERGELSFCYMSTVRFSRAAPELQLLELPFVVAGPRRRLRRPGRRVRRDAPVAGSSDTTPCRLLGYWDNGFRHLSNRVRPIRAPEDCRGIRIRTQMSELHGEVVPGARLRADRRRHQGVRGADRRRALPGPGQPAHEHLQLRRPPPPPLHHAERALLGRVRPGVQRGALPRLAGGRAGRRGRGGPRGDRATSDSSPRPRTRRCSRSSIPPRTR